MASQFIIVAMATLKYEFHTCQYALYESRLLFCTDEIHALYYSYVASYSNLLEYYYARHAAAIVLKDKPTTK